MKITLNGHAFDVPDDCSLAQLIAMRRESGHLTTPIFAVERNKQVVSKKTLGDVKLAAGDVVEVAVAVGGG